MILNNVKDTVSSSYQIGIDLGGSKTEAILLYAGSEVFRKRLVTPASSYTSILQTIITLVEECQVLAENFATIGIGMPGSITNNGLVKNSNTVCLNGKPFKADITAALQQEVQIMNDANCFVLSEAVDGAAKEGSIVFGVIIGTGVGGGIVVNKSPLIGCNNIAGEWGHNALSRLAPRVKQVDRMCYCGRLNCIETYLCGSGLSQTYREITEKNTSPECISELLDAGDECALQVFDVYCKQLAASLASVINVLDPDVIVLGGGLSNVRSLAITVEQYLPDYVFTDELMTKVVNNAHGDSSGVRGAARLWSGLESGSMA